LVIQAARNSFLLHKTNPEKNRLTGYEFLLPRSAAEFVDRQLDSIYSEEILSFLTHLSGGRIRQPSGAGIPLGSRVAQ
jgi:hypothetical protein